MQVVIEDINALVEQFNLSFGSTWTLLQARQRYSNFSLSGVEKARCGTQLVSEVWGGLDAWIKSMIVTSDNKPPPLLEPSDMPQLVVDVDAEVSDDDSDGDEAEGNESLPGAGT